MASNDERSEQFSFGEMALTEEPGRVPRFKFNSSDKPAFEEELNASESESQKLLQELKMATLNEEYSPEIIPYNAHVVDGVRALVATQTELLDEEEDAGEDQVSGFESHIKRMELDRINYLLRSYFRLRIKKIESHILYVFKEGGPYDQLSKPEQKFAISYMDLVETHFHRSFFSMLPEKLRKLDKDGHVHPTTAPFLDKFTFLRMRNTIGSYAVGDEDTDNPFDLNEGDILCTRYSRIRDLLLKNDAELI